MRIERFEEIEAWQRARELCRAVQEVIGSGEFARSFALRDQIDRASGSVMDNIAEGFDAGSSAEFVRFLRYAQRSCTEVKSQLYRALDRGFIDETQFSRLYQLSDDCHALIGGFIRYLLQTKHNEERNTKTF